MSLSSDVWLSYSFNDMSQKGLVRHYPEVNKHCFQILFLPIKNMNKTSQLPGIGVFGTGTVAKCLVPILKAQGFRVEALWGKSKEQAELSGEELDIKFRTNKVDEVLLQKDVDLVFITCPPHSQSPIAVKALGIGKHVICGVPSGPSQADTLKMVKAAEYYPSLMSMMCNGLRFLPCYVKMKQLIDDGYLGDPVICEARVHCDSVLKDKYDWMCDELMGGGVLNLYGSLIIDLITFLTGQKAVKVHGLLKTFTKKTDKIKGIRIITSDDFCSFQMELDLGLSVTVNLNSHLPGHFCHEMLVSGTKGRLVVRESELFGQKHDGSGEEILHKDSTSSVDIGSDKSHHIRYENLKTFIPLPHLKGLVRLVDSVKEAFISVEERHTWTKEPVIVGETFEDRLYVQAVVDAIRKSSKDRQWIKIKVMEEEPDPNMFFSDAMKRTTLSMHY